MYTFTDYFDTKKKKKPYSNAEDDLKDWLCALDMLIEAFMYYKADKLEDDHFHARGIRVSEEEMGDYFSLAPMERALGSRSLSVSAEMKKAIEHIRSREDASLNAQIACPLRAVIDEFSLGLHDIFIILISASVRYDLKYLRIYNYISDGACTDHVSAGVADALINFFLPSSASELEKAMSSSSVPGRFFLADDEPEILNTALLRPLIIVPAVYRYLLSGETGMEQKDDICDDDPIFFKAFSDLASDAYMNDHGVHLRYVESKDNEDVEYALGCAAHLSECALYSLKTKDITAMDPAKLKALLFTLRVKPGIILLTHDTADRYDDKYNRRIKNEFDTSLHILTANLKNAVIYVCGQERVPKMDVDAENAPALIDLPLPDAMLRIDIWHHFLDKYDIGLSEDIDIEDIADCHGITYTAIKRLCVQAKESLVHFADSILDRKRLQELLFKLDTSDFEHLATEVQAKYTWDDIYIEASQKKRLKAACDRYRLRGRVGDKWGINKKNAYGNAVILLMYGPPGTGKTMAAQAIANEVMTPLYRVDVSQVFSKYIGETQKNLSKIFDEASRRNVVLFFDEADALFTRRTEIKDSHDKYANSDTSFLLQKVEEYNGISILATNNFQSFDPAFMRRLSYVVRFERPDEATRRAMWEHMLPREVPMAADVDHDFLASRFSELTGSNIKSILLTAVYLAGAEGRSVGMRDIILAVRYEYEKLGRLIDSDEFGQYAVYLQV